VLTVRPESPLVFRAIPRCPLYVFVARWCLEIVHATSRSWIVDSLAGLLQLVVGLHRTGRRKIARGHRWPQRWLHCLPAGRVPGIARGLDRDPQFLRHLLQPLGALAIAAGVGRSPGSLAFALGQGATWGMKAATGVLVLADATWPGSAAAGAPHRWWGRCRSWSLEPEQVLQVSRWRILDVTLCEHPFVLES